MCQMNVLKRRWMKCYLPQEYARYIVLLGALIYNCNMAILNSYGNLAIYLASYLRKYNPNITYRDMGMIYNVAVISLSVSMLFGSSIQKRLKQRNTVILTSIYFFLAFYISSIYTHSIVVLYICLGFLCGVSCGISFTIPLACVYKYFKKKKGLISGIVVSACSLNPFIFCPLQTIFINRQNELPVVPLNNVNNTKELYFEDEKILRKVPTALFIQACILGTCCFISSFMITWNISKWNGASLPIANKYTIENLKNEKKEVKKENKKRNEKRNEKETNAKSTGNNNDVHLNIHITKLVEDNNVYCNTLKEGPKSLVESTNEKREHETNDLQKKYGMENSKMLEKTNQNYNEMKEEKTVITCRDQKCLKDSTFALIWISLAAFNTYINFFVMFWKLIGINYAPVDDKMLTLNGSILNSLSNILGRIVWGSLYDIIGLRYTILLLGSTITTSAFILPIVCHNFYLYLFLCALFNFCIGGSFVSIPIIALKKYGEQFFSLNMSILYSTRIANTIVGSCIIFIFYNFLSLKFLSLVFGGITFLAMLSLFHLVS